MPHQPDLSQSVMMQNVATAMVEAVLSLVEQGGVNPQAASSLLDRAIARLPAAAQAMIRFEAHRLWMIQLAES